MSRSPRLPGEPDQARLVMRQPRLRPTALLRQVWQRTAGVQCNLVAETSRSHVPSAGRCVHDRTKTVDLKQANRVLLQPHGRNEEVL